MIDLKLSGALATITLEELEPLSRHDIEFALELRNPSGGAGMPGAMSDADRNFLASIPPSLANTKEGRALIANSIERKTFTPVSVKV